MTHALPLAYRWQTPTLVASAGAFACVGFVLRGSAPGRWSAAAGVVGLWLLFLLVVWARTRASMVVDGPRLRVRNVRAEHTVEGAQLVRVEQFLTAHGPSYRLRVREEDGRVRRRTAPVALLRGGHAALFTWVLAHAPQAELDRGATRTLQQLRARGLVGDGGLVG